MVKILLWSRGAMGERWRERCFGGWLFNQPNRRMIAQEGFWLEPHGVGFVSSYHPAKFNRHLHTLQHFPGAETPQYNLSNLDLLELYITNPFSHCDAAALSTLNESFTRWFVVNGLQIHLGAEFHFSVQE
ncbi:hypothetical protein TNCV_2355021 [Trichonephila clavipes]|nr:hypothetical protein TNCV_2355021 [Trichonephila clavipes]